MTIFKIIAHPMTYAPAPLWLARLRTFAMTIRHRFFGGPAVFRVGITAPRKDK